MGELKIMKETIKLTVRLFLITAIAGFVLALQTVLLLLLSKKEKDSEDEEALREVFADADKFETLEDGKLNSIKNEDKKYRKSRNC